MSARETKRHNKEEKAVHKVTPAERTAVDKHFARREAKPQIRLKISKNGSDPQIELDHPDKTVGWALVMEALASADYDFANGIVDQLANASGHGQWAVRTSASTGSTSCCQSSKVLSRGISSRPCLGPDGGRARGEHDVRVPPRPGGDDSPAGQLLSISSPAHLRCRWRH